MKIFLKNSKNYTLNRNLPLRPRVSRFHAVQLRQAGGEEERPAHHHQLQARDRGLDGQSAQRIFLHSRAVRALPRDGRHQRAARSEGEARLQELSVVHEGSRLRRLRQISATSRERSMGRNDQLGVDEVLRCDGKTTAELDRIAALSRVRKQSAREVERRWPVGHWRKVRGSGFERN